MGIPKLNPHGYPHSHDNPRLLNTGYYRSQIWADLTRVGIRPLHAEMLHKSKLHFGWAWEFPISMPNGNGNDFSLVESHMRTIRGFI